MKIEPVQQCRSLDGWVPVKIESSSEPGKTYMVLTNPWSEVWEYICECPGYNFRGECRHQEAAAIALCRWHELVSEEEQSDAQRRAKICPRCGGPTMWVMEAVDE